MNAKFAVLRIGKTKLKKTKQKKQTFPLIRLEPKEDKGPIWQGRAWGGDLTFFKNLQSNSLPTGKSFQSNATKFPHPRLHIAVNPKAEPKKGTINISPNKTLQSFINVAVSPKIHVPVTAAFIRFNHNPCYTV